MWSTVKLSPHMRRQAGPLCTSSMQHACECAASSNHGCSYKLLQDEDFAALTRVQRGATGSVLCMHGRVVLSGADCLLLDVQAAEQGDADKVGKKRKKGKSKAGEEELFSEERAPADRAAALREAGTPPCKAPHHSIAALGNKGGWNEDAWAQHLDVHMLAAQLQMAVLQRA